MGMGREVFTSTQPSPLSRQMGTRRLGGSRYPFHGDEEVANVNGGDNFAAVQYSINPGQATLFPWLSKEAVLYEKYVFTQLEFYYQTLLNATSATAIGKVVYSVDFDAADAPPTTKQQAMDSEPAVSCAPWENMCLSIPKSQLRQAYTDGKYVRPGGLPGATDIKTYDLGNLNVITDSQGATTAIGELHVRYSGYFMNRVLEATTGAPNNNSVAFFQSVGDEASGATTVAKNLALATATVNGIVAVNTAGSFVLPPGNYLVDYDVQVTDTSVSYLTTKADMQVAGVSVWAAGNVPSVALASTGGTVSTSLAGSVFYASNGTSAVTFPVTNTYSAGSPTMGGSVRFTAI